jgi:EAL domain-containing protein (putative c-di-GMP-specific phosphodiesterase class I)
MALTEAMVRFAQDTGNELIAEGVETASELEVLTLLGVDHAQGYGLHRPLPQADLLSLF